MNKIRQKNYKRISQYFFLEKKTFLDCPKVLKISSTDNGINYPGMQFKFFILLYIL